MLVGIRSPDPNPKVDELKGRMLRYILLTHRLIFMQARGVVKMDQLKKLHMLTDREAALLDGKPAKCMIAFSWCVAQGVFRFMEATQSA